MSTVSLQEILECEFCPRVDSSLIAILLSELERPTPDEIAGLKETLRQLAAQAELEEARSEEDLRGGDGGSEQGLPETTATSTTNTSPSEKTSGNSSISWTSSLTTSSSSGSRSSPSSMSTTSDPPHSHLPHALEFLHAALPDVPTPILVQVLGSHAEEGQGVDMEVTVERLLTMMYLREREERGWDEDWEGDGGDGATDRTQIFTLPKSIPPPRKNRSKRAQSTTTLPPLTITLGNHRHAHGPVSAPPPSAYTSADRWSYLLSISYRASTLCEPTPPQIFQSQFHQQSGKSIPDALRWALETLETDANVDVEQSVPVLLSLTVTDPPAARLALRATRGRIEDALDLLDFLRELDDEHPVSPVSRPTQHLHQRAASGPLNERLTLSTAGPSNVNAWHTVPPRSPRAGPSSPRAVPRLRGRDAAAGRENLRRRDEMLRQASTAYKSRAGRGAGGAALVFAERARKHGEDARREMLDDARRMVEAKRTADTIDLHGTTIAEAVTIMKEILDREGVSRNAPLRIITGRGKHSVHRVGVLGPAVRKALVREGYDVQTWEAGLIVRGRT